MKTLTIEDLKKTTGVRDVHLNSQIVEHDLYHLAGCFDQVDMFLQKLKLKPSQQTDIKDLSYRHNTTVAMTEALKLWYQPNPIDATIQALLEILLDLRRGDVAISVCQFIVNELPNS